MLNSINKNQQYLSYLVVGSFMLYFPKDSFSMAQGYVLSLPAPCCLHDPKLIIKKTLRSCQSKNPTSQCTGWEKI